VKGSAKRANKEREIADLPVASALFAKYEVETYSEEVLFTQRLVSNALCPLKRNRNQTHGVAERGVKDLDPDLVLLWRVNRDVLDRDGLASSPGDGGFAGDDLAGVAGGELARGGDWRGSDDEEKRESGTDLSLSVGHGVDECV
jgi:hypothetical protein